MWLRLQSDLALLSFTGYRALKDVPLVSVLLADADVEDELVSICGSDPQSVRPCLNSLDLMDDWQVGNN